jgi:uncharacterized alkaline shock family protein YloU
MDETAGAVIISPQVITTVVRQVAESTPGVARLSSHPGRMSRVLRSNRSAGGVDVRVEDGAVMIDVHIIAMPNTQLLPLGQTLQRDIHRAISDVIGMPVRAVNIHFADVQDPLTSSTP